MDCGRSFMIICFRCQMKSPFSALFLFADTSGLKHIQKIKIALNVEEVSHKKIPLVPMQKVSIILYKETYNTLYIIIHKMYIP